MAQECFGNDSVHMFVSELTSRIVAESGIPTDRFHLGKIVLQSLKDDPDFVMQIDGATGQSETHGSMLERSVRCAMSLKGMGLKKDDVMVLMAPSHLDLAVPFYAGWYIGLAVAPADRTMNIYDLKQLFDTLRPKIVFCQDEKVQDIQETVNNLGLETIIVTFDESCNALNLSDMLEKCNFKLTISPVEVEAVIRQHPGVLDVAVTGVPDSDCGDLCVACVVTRPGCDVTKQEIKDIVKKNLSDSKQLRGGVIFMDELPLTPTTKLHRQKLKEIVMKRFSELDLQKD